MRTISCQRKNPLHHYMSMARRVKALCGEEPQQFEPPVFHCGFTFNKCSALWLLSWRAARDCLEGPFRKKIRVDEDSFSFALSVELSVTISVIS